MSPELPEELTERITAALDALEIEPDGRLPLQWRRKVRDRFGPEAEGLDRSPGRRRRVQLDRLCAEHVMPYWRSALPDDPRPSRMLELADELLAGRADPSAAEREKDRFEVDILDMESAGMDSRAASAGQAAVGVVLSTLAADYSSDLPADANDDDLDSDQWESCYFASLAEGSYPGAPDEEPEARREFWRWFLRQAVPLAYSSVQP